MIIEHACALSAPVKGMLWIERIPRSCVGCHAAHRGVCACMWSTNKRPYRVKARLCEELSNARIKRGTRLDVGLPAAFFLKSALLLYFVPTCTLLMGAAIAGKWWQNELAILLGAVLGLGVGLIYARLVLSPLKQAQLHPLVLRVVEDSQATPPDAPQKRTDILATHQSRDML